MPAACPLPMWVTNCSCRTRPTTSSTAGQNKSPRSWVVRVESISFGALRAPARFVKAMKRCIGGIDRGQEFAMATWRTQQEIDTSDDLTLVHAAKRGAMAAFEQLVERHTAM